MNELHSLQFIITVEAQNLACYNPSMSQKKFLQKSVHALFTLVIVATVLGELKRFSVAGIDLLPSDLLIPVLLVVWGMDKVQNDRTLRIGKIGMSIVVFLFTMLTVYVLNFLRFDTGQLLSGFANLGRLGLYAFLSLIGFDLLQRDEGNRFRNLLVGTMISSALLVSILGFFQLKYFPSFFDLELYLEGWDPHIGRLLSTWFDPNFVGGFLAFMLPVILGVSLYYFHRQKTKKSLVLGAIAFIVLVAIYLTFSRSAYLALILGMGTFTLIKSRKLLVAFVMLMVLGFSFSERVQERTLGAVDSAKNLVGLNEQKPMDATSQFRVDSWMIALELIKENPIMGVGYGRYAQAVNEQGMGIGLEVHSSTGSDSSLLTIWAQAGLVGLISYLAIVFVAAVIAIKRSWKKNDFNAYLILGLLSGFAGMMIHSFFVNSLLFALMMVYLWVGLALIDEK